MTKHGKILYEIKVSNKVAKNVCKVPEVATKSIRRVLLRDGKYVEKQGSTTSLYRV